MPEGSSERDQSGAGSNAKNARAPFPCRTLKRVNDLKSANPNMPFGRASLGVCYCSDEHHSLARRSHVYACHSPADARNRMMSPAPAERAEIVNAIERSFTTLPQLNTANLGCCTYEDSGGVADGLSTDTRVQGQPDLDLKGRLQSGGESRIEAGIESNQGMSGWDLMVLEIVPQEPARVQAGAHEPIPLVVEEPSGSRGNAANSQVLPNVDPGHHHCSEKLSFTVQSDMWSCCESCGLLLPQRSFRRFLNRLVAVTADCVSLVVAGLAVVVILRFHHQPNLDQYRGEENSRLRLENVSPTFFRLLAAYPDREIGQPCATRLPWLGSLKQVLRCPSLSVYLIAIATYSAAGIFHLVRPPRFWADFGLVAAGASVLAGSVLSSRTIAIDGFILGGFLSLFCCYILEWLTRVCQLPACQLTQSRASDAGWVDLERTGNAKGVYKSG